MTLIIISMVCFGLCYKWGIWKNWKLYYPTILFYIIGALTENFITDKNPLWIIYGMTSKDIISDYFIACFIFPFVIILFLSNYPKRIKMQIVYVTAFAFVSSLIEFIVFVKKGIIYKNGWNIGWSALLYILVFPMLQLHYRRPLLAWLLFFLLVLGGMLHFKIQLSDLG
jgi:hypothetical protein